MAKKNCNAKHDGCCPVTWSCWNAAVEQSSAMMLLSQVARQRGGSTCFGFVFFFLGKIMSGLWNGLSSHQ